MAKLKVLVLFGGTSYEYDDSLRSAAAVCRTLSANDRYEVVPVGITKKGRWLYFPGDYAEILEHRWEQNPDCASAVLSPDPAHRGILILEDEVYALKRIDVIFPLLFGRLGEDGSVQGLCEMSHIPYIGNGILSSALCRNKVVTHMLLNAVGIQTPQWTAVSCRSLDRLHQEYERIESIMNYPLYVKPAGSDASMGAGIAANRETLSVAIKRAFTKDKTVLVEQLIQGREYRVAVFGYDPPFTSFVGEIVHGHDSDSLVIPANCDANTASILRDTAISAFHALECKDLALFDFYCEANGAVLLGEVHTMPALSPSDIYPLLMNDLGMPYAYLLDKLISQAMEHADRGI